MAPPFPRRSSQLAAVVREEIAKRTWVGILPGERALAEHFQVSRKTVRAALRELRAEGVIVTRKGAGSVIKTERRLRSRRGGELVPETIGLLLPRPLAEQRQHTTLWVNMLADLLGRVGYRLTIFSGRKYFADSGGRALTTLTKTHPMAGWLVAQSTRFVQRWFADSGLPAVIAGSLHQGVALPSVDIDHVALCRHAAGVLIRAGHRRIALLYPKTGRAGDLESEEGFRQGCRQSPAAITPLVVQHEDDSGSVYAATARLLELKAAPTGLLITNSTSYLTVASCLAAHHRRIPQDMSVLSRDEDSFLYHMMPVPDRYYVNPDKFAAQVKHALLTTLKGDPGTQVTVRIMPQYRTGGSVAAPASE